MNDTPSHTTPIILLGQSIDIKCPIDKIASLQASAHLVNEKMQEIKDSGQAVSSERIAMIAALNLAYELLTLQNTSPKKTENISGFVQRLSEKIELAEKER